MKFSIITVCRNSEKTIRRTFDAMLNQSFKEYEYIVIDGASADSTVDIIREYELRFDGRMRWISEPDDGIYDAMNKGIRMAKGEIIGLCNSDDFYESEALLNVNNAMEENPGYDVYYGIARFINPDGREKQLLRVSASVLQDEMLVHSATFVSRNAYEKYGTFDTAFKIAADYDFMLRLFSHGGTFCPLDKILVSFTLGTGVSTLDPRKCMMDARYVRYRHKLISSPMFFCFLGRYIIGRILKCLKLIK